MANDPNKYGGQQGQTGSDQQHRQDQQRDTEVSPGGRSEGVSQMAASVREVAGDAADRVKKKAHDVGEIAEEKAEALATWIKEKPITSVLIGAAVGASAVCLVGWVTYSLTRKR